MRQHPTYETISDLPLEERHAIVRGWLDALTTIYEKTTAERDAQMERAEALLAEIVHRARIDVEDMQRIQGWAGNLYEENTALRAALAAIRDYVENPAAVSAEGMTDAEKIGGMWSQAVAALPGPAERGDAGTAHS